MMQWWSGFFAGVGALIVVIVLFFPDSCTAWLS